MKSILMITLASILPIFLVAGHTSYAKHTTYMKKSKKIVNNKSINKSFKLLSKNNKRYIQQDKKSGLMF